MRAPLRTTLLALVAALAMPFAATAGTGQSSFGVGLRVLPATAAAEAVPGLPVPGDSQVLDLGADRGSWVSAGDPDAIARFYEQAMPGLGYRLAMRQDDASGARLTWDDGAGTRIRMDIRRMLGQADGSWIVATTA
jgi:hypothetical protein